MRSMLLSVERASFMSCLDPSTANASLCCALQSLAASSSDALNLSVSRCSPAACAAEQNESFADGRGARHDAFPVRFPAALHQSTPDLSGCQRSCCSVRSRLLHLPRQFHSRICALQLRCCEAQ